MPPQRGCGIIAGIPYRFPRLSAVVAHFDVVMVGKRLVGAIFQNGRVDVVIKLKIGGILKGGSDEPFVLGGIVVAVHGVDVEIEHGAPLSGVDIVGVVACLEEVVAWIMKPRA